MYTVTPGSEQIRATIERDGIVSAIFWLKLMLYLNKQNKPTLLIFNN